MIERLDRVAPCVHHGSVLRERRRTAPTRALIVVALAALTLLLLAACGGGSSAATVTATTPVARTATPAPPTATPTPTETPSATPTPTPASAPAAVAPTEGHWIDVDVTTFMVRLMDGKQVVQEIGPIAVGAQVDTGAYESTQTGLFHVYNKIAPLSYDAPYKTYIQWWVGFDPQKANGFHSFLEDQDGKVVDGSTGRVSNGCIRTPNPKALFDFADIGTPVYVHT